MPLMKVLAFFFASSYLLHLWNFSLHFLFILSWAFWGYSLIDTNSLIHSSTWIITLLNQSVEFIIPTIIFCTFTISSCIPVISFYAWTNIKILRYLMIFNILLQNIFLLVPLIVILWSRWFCSLSFFYTDCVTGEQNLQRWLANETSDSVYVSQSLELCVCMPSWCLCPCPPFSSNFVGLSLWPYHPEHAGTHLI